jgi:Zinc finger, C3HC4 type (RING finger)
MAELVLVDSYEDCEEDSQQHQLTALQRQCWAAETVMAAVDRVLPLVQLAALLACWSGVSNTPDAAMLLTGMTYRRQQTSQLQPPQLHVTYAHPRWLYEQGLETVKLLMAGLAIANAVWSPVVRDALMKPVLTLLRRCRRRLTGVAAATTNSICPICRHVPTAAAVQTACGHVYCYACLYQVSAATQQCWCRICGSRIITATACPLPDHPQQCEELNESTLR